MSSRYVGIDLHKRRSVVIRVDGSGERLGVSRITNSPTPLTRAIKDPSEHFGEDFGEDFGEEPGEAVEVLIEATCGWYWAVDTLAEAGARVHLANLMGLNWGHRRVHNDEHDGADPLDMLRLDRLAEAWIAPPSVRELRELVRYRMLGRHRHKARYAEDRIMPMLAGRMGAGAVSATRSSA